MSAGPLGELPGFVWDAARENYFRVGRDAGRRVERPSPAAMPAAPPKRRRRRRIDNPPRPSRGGLMRARQRQWRPTAPGTFLSRPYPHPRLPVVAWAHLHAGDTDVLDEPGPAPPGDFAFRAYHADHFAWSGDEVLVAGDMVGDALQCIRLTGDGPRPVAAAGPGLCVDDDNDEAELRHLSGSAHGLVAASLGSERPRVARVDAARATVTPFRRGAVCVLHPRDAALALAHHGRSVYAWDLRGPRARKVTSAAAVVDALLPLAHPLVATAACGRVELWDVRFAGSAPVHSFRAPRTRFSVAAAPDLDVLYGVACAERGGGPADFRLHALDARTLRPLAQSAEQWQGVPSHALAVASTARALQESCAALVIPFSFGHHREMSGPRMVGFGCGLGSELGGGSGEE